jgi:hypothetical protein
MSDLSRYEATRNANRACCDPPGPDSVTCGLQKVRCRALSVLAARVAQVIALAAPAELGLCGASSRETSHANGEKRAAPVTKRSNQNPPRRRRLDDMAGQNIGRVVCTAESGRIGQGGTCGAAGPASALGSALEGPPAEPYTGTAPRSRRLTRHVGRASLSSKVRCDLPPFHALAAWRTFAG